MEIKYLKHNEIDISKWDKSVALAKNGFPYAFSWYLDAVSENWEALITADYQYVMPLPVKKKIGIKYVIQPYFCQQLGVFSQEIITENIVNEFVKHIPYKFFALQINCQNPCKAMQLPNLILSLSDSYKNIAQNFSENTKRNIHKAKKFGLKIKTINSVEFLDFWKMENFEKFPQHFSVLKKLVNIKNNSVKLYCVDNQLNNIIAANLILETDKRIINLVPISNLEGKEKSAMFFLLNHLIEKYAGQDMVLDFEGSRIQGVARFYKGFGTNNEPYFFIQKNCMQWLINIKSRIIL